ncbi:MAG: AI-2E family transporter, partial [Armatimonadetes bacterium]|nr:AI-2E family transporter [Armatimonadota bacterium]
MQTKISWYQILLLVLATAVLVAFLYLVRSILPPFVIAFAIAWLLDPLLDKIQRRGCPRVLAITGVYVVFLAAF